MMGDVDDMTRRLAALLPWRWFEDTAPVLTALLNGVGSAWAAIFALVSAVRAESRILSASGSFLDVISADFFGSTLPRRENEDDDAFRARVELEMLRPRGTRAAVTRMLLDLTGMEPAIFEPTCPGDCGGYGAGGVGYGAGGGYGSLLLPFQFFVTAYRPSASGIALLAGYGTGGQQAYGDLAMVSAPVQDADIFAAVSSVLPAATTAWTRIT